VRLNRLKARKCSTKQAIITSIELLFNMNVKLG
jgi:hypothetical protein